MSIYVACWPIVASLAGELIPAIGNGELNKVIKVAFIALAVFLIQKLFQFGQDTLLAEPALRISQDLRNNLFVQLQKIELHSLEKLSSGDLIYRLTEDADRVGEVIYKTIQDTLPSLLQLIAVFGYMTFIDWQLSLTTLFLAPIVAILISKFGAKVLKAAEKSQKKVSDLASLLGEAIQGLKIVKAFGAEAWMQSRFEKEVNQHRQARFKTMRLLALQHPVVGFIEATGIITILAIGAARIQSGGLDAQGFSSYVAALLMLIDPISHLTINFNEFQQGQASLKRLRQIEKEPKEKEDSLNANDIKNPKGELNFEAISFSYQKNLTVINELSLTINPGKVIAFVGPSGAGKSTLFSLLLRFITPDKGKIYFDGYELSTLKRSFLRSQIAIVPQQITLFSGSISDTISFGRQVSQEQIIEASKLANAHNFIDKLPNKYDTRLEERGTNISGGQIQRLAIARAIIGNPSLLLLDEATSALDADSEESVRIGLKQAMANRTVLVIAHRLSTVQTADQIVVMENGTISEIGIHDELITKMGKYQELCSKQFIRNI